MCRMLIASGQLDVPKILDAFLKMTADENEKHERNDGKAYNHPDGWGLAYLDEGKCKIYKKETPIWDDEMLDKYREIKTGTIILHARRSSGTKASYENTQPFFRKAAGSEFVFTHNGSVMETLEYEDEYYPLGDTDSEMCFYYVLSALRREGPAGLPRHLKELNDYSAANFILMEYPTAIVNVQYKKDPLYYTMKLYKDDKSIMVSSETLQGYEDREWVRLGNEMLVTINLQTLEHKMESYANVDH